MIDNSELVVGIVPELSLTEYSVIFLHWTHRVILGRVPADSGVGYGE